MSKEPQYIEYQGVRMEVLRRFEFKTIKKLEVYNPVNKQQFIINEYELTRTIDQSIKE
jgi:hypothetical protein